MKAVKEKLPEQKLPEEELLAFEKGAAAYAKKIIANFKDYEFVSALDVTLFRRLIDLALIVH